MVTPQYTINTVYVSSNNLARVQVINSTPVSALFYAVQVYDLSTRTYTHYKTFANKHVAIAIAEDVSNT